MIILMMKLMMVIRLFLTVMIFQSQPYSMVRQSQERLAGNEAFEGFAIDLIAEIAEILSKADAVDFSMPFMNLGISILYKKPQKKPPDLFSFSPRASVSSVAPAVSSSPASASAWCWVVLAASAGWSEYISRPNTSRLNTRLAVLSL